MDEEGTGLPAKKLFNLEKELNKNNLTRNYDENDDYDDYEEPLASYENIDEEITHFLSKLPSDKQKRKEVQFEYVLEILRLSVKEGWIFRSISSVFGSFLKGYSMENDALKTNLSSLNRNEERNKNLKKFISLYLKSLIVLSKSCGGLSPTKQELIDFIREKFEIELGSQPQ